MEKAIDISKKYIPYILIFAFSLFATHLVFYEGINIGDDFYFHLTNIYDRYLTVLDGKGLSPISGNLASGLGSGTELVYSPLSHFVILVWALILNVLGGSFLLAYKTSLVFSVFLSGIFMYRFAMHFTKGNRVAALISASVYIFYPYRLFDMFCRVALGEAIAFTFIPLFLMGLYDIVELSDEIKIMPFIETILGGSLLYLSHNITALFVFVVGIIYLLVSLPKIIRLLKHKKYVIYGAVSVILLIGITAIALFPQMEMLSSELYNISDEVTMWTDAETVSGRVYEEWKYSGFLNVAYLSGKNLNSSFVVMGVLMYLIACFVFAVSDKLLEKIEIFKKYHVHLVPSFAILWVMVSLISTRIESYLSVIIFFTLYAFYHIFTEGKEKKDKSDVYKSTLFWLSVAVIVASLVLMQSEGAWLKMPKIFLNIQFPWRLWTLVQVFLSVLVGVLAHYYIDNKKIIIVLAVFAGFLMIANEPTIEKRTFRRLEIRWVDGIEEADFDRGIPLGFNKEYTPSVFFDSEYKSQYKKSLYRQVKNRIGGTFYDYEDYSLSPVILDGDGKITTDYAFAPKYNMQIELSKDSLVQMPLIYYKGYKITAENNETGEVIVLSGENVDGLVSFSLASGSYTVSTDFVGSPLRKAGVTVTVISIVVVLGAIAYALLIENKRYLVILNKFKKTKKAEE